MPDFKELLERRRRAHERFEQGGEPQPVRHIPISITVAGNDYAIRFGYDRALLEHFKRAVPEFERTWHKSRKVWLVSPAAIGQAKAALEDYTHTAITIPAIPQTQAQLLGKTFLLEYLGQTKDRGGRKSAYGFVNNDWSAEFPEEVLRAFFEGREAGKPAGNIQTLYQVLCVFEKVEQEAIKSAYRRLARQWHPDVCGEPDAAKMFRKINEAYLILIDPNKRQRYDAGLYFERQGQDQTISKPAYKQYGYRAPLRCGNITAIGTARLMRFVVQEITAWEDVTNAEGKVMTSQWPAGAEKFQVLWI